MAKQDTTKKTRGRPKGGGEAAAERRQKVRSLKGDGFTNIQIAEILACDRNTVARDLDFLKKEVRDTAKEADSLQELGEAMQKYKDLEEQAMKVLRAVAPEDTRTRLECIKTAGGFQKDRIELAMRSGLIPKVERDDDKDFVNEIAQLSDAELDKRQRALLKRMDVAVTPLRESRKEPGPAKKAEYEAKQSELSEGLDYKEGSEHYPPPPPLEETLEEAGKFFEKKELDIVTGQDYEGSEDTPVEENKPKE